MFSGPEVAKYHLLFTGRLTSNTGRTMRTFARAIWVFEATGSPLRMGIAVSALSWPMLFIPLIAGVTYGVTALLVFMAIPTLRRFQ